MKLLSSDQIVYRTTRIPPKLIFFEKWHSDKYIKKRDCHEFADNTCNLLEFAVERLPGRIVLKLENSLHRTNREQRNVIFWVNKFLSSHVVT
jgi:hypothetical protein